MGDDGALRCIGRPPGNDDVCPPGKRAKCQAVPGATPHDDGPADRQSAKQLEIGRKFPRQSAVPANDAVARSCDHSADAHDQTATGATMWGSASYPVSTKSSNRKAPTSTVLRKIVSLGSA